MSDSLVTAKHTRTHTLIAPKHVPTIASTPADLGTDWTLVEGAASKRSKDGGGPCSQRRAQVRLPRTERSRRPTMVSRPRPAQRRLRHSYPRRSADRRGRHVDQRVGGPGHRRRRRARHDGLVKRRRRVGLAPAGESCRSQARRAAVQGRHKRARHQHQGRSREQDADTDQQDLSGDGRRPNGAVVRRRRDPIRQRGGPEGCQPR